MANEKSKAELYRDERKARIAATAKKNAKSMEKRNAAKKVFKKVIAIVLAAVIALGAVGGVLNYYGVWDRVIRAGAVGGREGSYITVAEYQYYYRTYYENFLSQIQQYSAYGYTYDYDTSLTPEEQTSTTTDADGNEVTWSEYLRDQVIDQIQVVKTYYLKGVEAGLDELTEQEKKSIDDQIEQYREAAESTEDSSGNQKLKYTLNAYLRQNFGGYMTESFLRRMLEESYIASKYYQQRLETLKDEFKQDEVDEVYNADKDAYDLVDLRYYEFAKSTLTANDGESNDALEKRQEEADKQTKADADAFFAAVTDEASFVAKAKEFNAEDADYDVDSATKASGQLKESIEQNLSAEIAKWVYDDATKSGSKKLFTSEDESTYTVVLVIKAPYQTDTVNVRHILFATTDTSTGEALSDDEIAQKKKDAEACLAEWQAGDKSEDSFAALAEQNSEDTGSNSNGGLYTNVTPGSMITEFDAWIFDGARKTGDTAIVETDYGYHVMYFSGKGSKYYDSVIRDDLAEKKFEEEAADLLQTEEYAINLSPRFMQYSEDKTLKKIKKLLSQSSSSSSSASYY